MRFSSLMLCPTYTFACFFFKLKKLVFICDPKLVCRFVDFLQTTERNFGTFVITLLLFLSHYIHCVIDCLLFNVWKTKWDNILPYCKTGWTDRTMSSKNKWTSTKIKIRFQLLQLFICSLLLACLLACPHPQVILTCCGRLCLAMIVMSECNRL